MAGAGAAAQSARRREAGGGGGAEPQRYGGPAGPPAFSAGGAGRVPRGGRPAAASRARWAAGRGPFRRPGTRLPTLLRPLLRLAGDPLGGSAALPLPVGSGPGHTRAAQAPPRRLHLQLQPARCFASPSPAQGAN